MEFGMVIAADPIPLELHKETQMESEFSRREK